MVPPKEVGSLGDHPGPYVFAAILCNRLVLTKDVPMKARLCSPVSAVDYRFWTRLAAPNDENKSTVTTMVGPVVSSDFDAEDVLHRLQAAVVGGCTFRLW